MLAVGIVVTVGLTAAVGAVWVGGMGTGETPSVAVGATIFLLNFSSSCLSFAISVSRFCTSASRFCTSVKFLDSSSERRS